MTWPFKEFIKAFCITSVTDAMIVTLSDSMSVPEISVILGRVIVTDYSVVDYVARSEQEYKEGLVDPAGLMIVLC